MTGLLVLAFIPAAAAVLFWLRVREQRLRIAELTRALAAGTDSDRAVQDRYAALLGTVAHELRSPIAAILGYEELMSEGVFGELDARAVEALRRIRSSACQLLTLTDGMQELGQEGAATEVELEELDFDVAFHEALERAAGEAQARRVELVRADEAPSSVPGRSERRAVDAILNATCGAVLKSSADRTVHARLVADEKTVQYRFEGTGIDCERVENDPFASGAGLRIAIARRLAARLGGVVQCDERDGSAEVVIALPRRL